jgi:hypothetical protein
VLSTALRGPVVFPGLALYVTLNIHLAGRPCIITCTRAYECMIAKPKNMDNLGSHMHIVIYVGVLIRSSFGGVC